MTDDFQTAHEFGGMFTKADGTMGSTPEEWHEARNYAIMQVRAKAIRDFCDRCNLEWTPEIEDNLIALVSWYSQKQSPKGQEVQEDEETVEGGWEGPPSVWVDMLIRM